MAGCHPAAPILNAPPLTLFTALLNRFRCAAAAELNLLAHVVRDTLQRRIKEKHMKKIIPLAAAILLSTGVAAYAQSKSAFSSSPGASEATPADSMKDRSSTKSGPGASQFTPGHEQKQKTPGGASEFSPGDKMNDAHGQGGR
jgi:hypothetical protein